MSCPIALSLDLRQLAPPARHALIFSGFAALLPGQALELINDHDPRTLNRQLEASASGRFSWTYLEQGPQHWRVRIEKSAGGAAADSGACCSGGACCG